MSVAAARCWPVLIVTVPLEMRRGQNGARTGIYALARPKKAARRHRRVIRAAAAAPAMMLENGDQPAVCDAHLAHSAKVRPCRRARLCRRMQGNAVAALMRVVWVLASDRRDPAVLVSHHFVCAESAKQSDDYCGLAIPQRAWGGSVHLHIGLSILVMWPSSARTRRLRRPKMPRSCGLRRSE